ncbi:MAG: hypothetical protein H6733_09175 [Alphaproteobacteria bacterium]|nr:hypothetical protein [Alphaproteobacteria bacterium]
MLLGIAITRAASLDPTWTTIHLVRAALARGHRVRMVEPWDFEVDERGQLTARAYAFDEPVDDVDVLVNALRARTSSRRYIRLDTLDVLLMRAAPLDPSLLAFAAMARASGVAVVNDPDGLLQVTHKAWLATLPDVPRPPTLVTRSPGTAALFYERLDSTVIVKPARGSGGRDVMRVAQGDVRSFELAFSRVRMRGEHVVIQGYLEQASEGEKRLVWMDGDILGGYLRRSAPGEFRHNLKQGGTPEPTDVTPAEQQAMATLSPHLLRAGIRIAGVDLIGQHVIEVNALNPGGAFHADRLHGTDVSGSIIERLERADARTAPRRTAWAPPAP